MKFALCAMSVFLAACATVPHSAGEAAVIQTLHDACRAYQDGNADRIAELLTPDFTLTDAAGVVTTREDDLRNARTGAIRYTVFENHDMIARLYGDSAVVTGITRVRGSAGETAFSADFQFTDTLVRQNDRWRVAASHISRLSVPTPPAR